jgi:hypothetical protein
MGETVGRLTGQCFITSRRCAFRGGTTIYLSSGGKPKITERQEQFLFLRSAAGTRALGGTVPGPVSRESNSSGCPDGRAGQELKTDPLRASIGCMPGMIYRIVGVAAIAATLFLSGCNFGGNNSGDVYGAGETGQSSLEHKIPESQRTGTVTGEPGPETSRY